MLAPSLQSRAPMPLLLACLLAYLLGGIPCALLLVRAMAGVDVRTIGSGNVGATNAARAFTGGKKAGAFVLIYTLDFAKGFVPTCYFGTWFGLPEHGAWTPVLLGCAAILGHVASPYLGFRGGKGVATTCGVIAAIDWLVLLSGLVVFGLVFALGRRVFVGSIALGLALPLAAWARGHHGPVLGFTVAVAVFLVFTHRSNLKRAFAARAAKAVGS